MCIRDRSEAPQPLANWGAVQLGKTCPLHEEDAQGRQVNLLAVGRGNPDSVGKLAMRGPIPSVLSGLRAACNSYKMNDSELA